MLNRRTTAASQESPPRAIRGEATWRCQCGHSTKVWLVFDGRNTFDSSAGRLCDHCGATPTPVEDTKARVSIFSKWRDQGDITTEAYRTLAIAAAQTPYTTADAPRPSSRNRPHR